MSNQLYDDAIKEIKAEIEWRTKMYNKAENDKKREYWMKRVQDAHKVNLCLETMKKELSDIRAGIDEDTL